MSLLVLFHSRRRDTHELTGVPVGVWEDYLRRKKRKEELEFKVSETTKELLMAKARADEDYELLLLIAMMEV
jgi:hypothetical protein